MFDFFVKSRYLFAAAVFAFILGAIGYGVHSGSEPAPDVTFTTITGKKIALNALRGKPVIVTFWASDCAACIKEMPHLIEWYRQFHGQGLEIIAVAMFYDPPSRVVSMTKVKRLPYDVALDLSAGLARAFGNVALTPTTFLISPEGRIIERIIGVINPAKMKTLIERLLKG